MRSRINETLASVQQTIRRYPMVLAMALACAGCMIYIILNEKLGNQFVYETAKVGMTTGYGISLMFGIKMLSQRIGKQFLLELAGCVFLILYYLAFPASSKEFTDNYVFVIVPVAVLFHLFVAVAPFLTRNDDISFWRYNKNLFVNFILTIIFTGVLVLGVELAIEAVNALFGLELSSKVYLATGSFLAIFGSVFIFLRFNETGLPDLEKDEEYPVVLKFFVQYILIPLLLLYFVIMLLYSAKILMQWELPKGWVSLLVMCYAVVGILAILLVHPLVSSAKSWVKGFSRIFFFTLIPLLVLLFVALKTRILQYGFTEPRYYLLLISLWLCAVVAHFALLHKHTIRFIPMSLLLMGIFGLLCPYFNAKAVSVRSQEKELMRFATEKKMMNNGKIIPDKTSYELQDKVRYLIQRRDSDFVLQILDDKTKKRYLASGKSADFNPEYGEMPNFEDTMQDRFFISVRQTERTNVAGYDYMIQPDTYTHINLGDAMLDVDTDNMTARLNNDESVSLKPQLLQFAKAEKAKAGSSKAVSTNDISAVAEFKKYSIRIGYSSVELGDDDKLYVYQRYILVKKKP